MAHLENVSFAAADRPAVGSLVPFPRPADFAAFLEHHGRRLGSSDYVTVASALLSLSPWTLVPTSLKMLVHLAEMLLWYV